MKYVIKEDAALREKVHTYTDEQLLKAVTCPNYFYNTLDKLEDTYCFFFHPAKLSEIKEIQNAVKEKIKHPYLLASDMECGPGNAIVGATAFPSMRAFRETGDSAYAYKAGAAAATEALDAGYNWTFAPCVDILGNEFSPITSIRSAGSTADDVISYALEYAKGIQDNGMVATAKHFPGDGNCLFDQHLTTAVNPLSKEKWDASYRRVYETAVNNGIKSIMPGHIALPCYDEKDERGIYPPATLSKRLLTGLLKNDIGFEGLIISDATEMGGFCGYMNYYKACATFLEAGGDCLLFTHPDEEYIRNMKAHMASGLLKRSTLEDRAYRVIAFVYDNYSDKRPSFDRKEHERIAKEVTYKSVKVFRDRNGVLPISKKPLKIASVLIANQIDKSVFYELSDKLYAYGEVTVLEDPGCFRLKQAAKNDEFDLMVVTSGCTQWYGTNQITLSGTVSRNMMNGWMKYNTPVVFVDFGNPYFHREYDASADCIIYTYGHNGCTVDAVIERIFEK